jgi:regulator of protease activity HflC (stomatin/prohibitin superfamily)
MRALRVCVVAISAAVALLALAVSLQLQGSSSRGLRIGIWVAGIVLAVVGVQSLRGLTVVTPGDAFVVQLFGRYLGTIRAPGLHWVNPLAVRRRMSVRIRNYATDVTKVTDAEGNPIEISVVLVWQVGDTARALYEVEDFVQFAGTQCEAAVRHVAARYHYDAQSDERPSLYGDADEITDQLTAEIAARVEVAGIRAIESRIVRLAYAPEIAQAMLRRQQAGAIVTARQQIVEGAVGMVELALNRLDEENVVELDEERKAAMVSNLLVVLCSDHPTQPIVNAGSLYH